ncbi:MAG: PAS domain-containing sensor histidine kinase [Nitrospirae bacterium]|nr:PAS domain-containing sensor histidine kinase [Nitrospirota bacterium]
MVYQNFLEHHLDYIFFLYGMSFYVLALYCFLAARSSSLRLPWNWLGAFAAVHGTSELVELTLGVIDGLPHFALFKYVLLLVSYTCLMEFGRVATAWPGGGGRWRAVYPFLLASSLVGAFWGPDGLNTTVRYTVGLPAGLWASAALLKASREGGVRDTGLGLAGIAMAVYAIATGFVVPDMPFIPASIINYDTFTAAFGFNVQLLRLLLIFTVSVSLVAHFRKAECGRVDASSWNMQHCSLRPFAMVLAFLLMGWPATEMVGRHVEDEASANLISRTLTAAASILPERVAALTGTSADEGTPAFEHLRNDLMRIKSVNPDFRFVYLMGLRDGQEIFLVDAEPKDSEDYSTPGDVYPDATQKEVEEFKKGRPKVYPPYKDSWGTWVSGVAFIKDPVSGEVKAMLGMDIDADKWLHQVALSRLLCMMLTFALSVITVIQYFAWQRSRESAEQRAALRLAEQKLYDEKKLRDLVDSLGEGVIVQDADGYVVLVNPEAERLLARGSDAMVGRPLEDALGLSGEPEDGCLPPMGGVIPTLDCGDTCRMEDAVFIRGDGTALPVSYVLSPITESGKLTGAVMAFQDISIRKEMERQKKDFFAMVTHDLKSPLLVIQGYTDILLGEKASALDEEARGMLASVRDGGRKMLTMVNDFLTVSRFESGKLSLNESLDDLGAAVVMAVEEISPLANKKHITIETGDVSGLERLIFDKAHLVRALSNLLHNAVHYTAKGGTVSVSVHDVIRDGAEYAAVTVSDNGPGIPPDEREKVFCMYYRSARTEGLKGSGLGLAIVKAVAVAHGGAVELDSEEGRGSTFRLLIPRNTRH